MSVVVLLALGMPLYVLVVLLGCALCRMAARNESSPSPTRQRVHVEVTDPESDLLHRELSRFLNESDRPAAGR